MMSKSRTVNIHCLVAAMLAMTFAAACSRDEGVDYAGSSEVVISLSTGSAVTRADDCYESDPYAEAEEAIERVDLFFFGSESGTDAAFFTWETSNFGAVTSADLTVKMPIELKAKFSGSSAYVYALVNLPEEIRVDASANTVGGRAATLANLRSLSVDEPRFVGSGAVPSTFVMRGGAVVTLTSTAAASGKIMLERLASKIRLWADFPAEVHLDADGNMLEEGDTDAAESVWTAVPETDGVSNVKLYIYNVATRGRMDGSTSELQDSHYANVDRADEDVVRLIGRDVTLNAADRDSEYPYSHEVAYYSYPNEWDSSLPSEPHRTYVIVSLPWRSNTNEFRTCYYRVPVNALRSATEPADCLRPNRYYRIKIFLGMMGSTNIGEPTDVDASYEVVDWVSQTVDVNIKDRRYLVVNQKDWTMSNNHTLAIPFSTSHKTEISACYINVFRYNDVWGTDRESTSFNFDNFTHSAPEHTSPEFGQWLSAAEGKGIKTSEGEIWATVQRKDVDDQDISVNTMLYYKQKYFYDKTYESIEGDGYRYYVGHEHPRSFQKDYIARPGTLTQAESEAWGLYNEKYDSIDSVYTCNIDHTNNLILFTHPLVEWKEKIRADGTYYYVPETKNGKLRDEYSRCEVIIKIKHKDWDSSKDGLYEETVYITQYPAMYIEVSHDYGNVFTVPGRGAISTTRNSFNEYVLTNGNTTKKQETTNAWYEVNGHQIRGFGGINNNPNMYLIHTTQLSDDSTFEIGDPRSLHWNNLLTDASMPNTEEIPNNANQWTGNAFSFGKYTVDMVNATRLYPKDGSQKMEYYYPTDETTGDGSKVNFVAPSFRIASSFGKVASGHKEEARKRCAVYQEAGRPAGRWRLPTRAEVVYIATLSADGKIPVLFGNTEQPDAYGYYWCAQGPLAVNAHGDVMDMAKEDQYGNSPRCVYDEWYWTKLDAAEGVYEPDPLETTFYWGDRLKDNTQQ